MKHKRNIAPDLASTAVCTGGLVNQYGRRLTNCRSTVCPAHHPENYVGKHAGKHAGEYMPEAVSLGAVCIGQHCNGRRMAEWHRNSLSPRHVIL